MTQAQLNRAVARATGEPVRTIARMGFALGSWPARGGRAKRARRRQKSKNRTAGSLQPPAMSSPHPS